MYLLVVLLAVAFGQVAQLDPNNFPDKLRTSEWLMVYVYSPTCGHCKDFTPLYEKLANQLKDNVEFGKIDGNMYTDFGTKYKVTSFPTVMLFYSGIDLPLTYFDERKVSKIKEWIQAKMSFELPLKTQAEQGVVIYHGEQTSPSYKLVKLLALRDQYKEYHRMALEDGQQPSLTLSKWKSSDFTPELETELRKITSHLLDFGEEAWLSMVHKKMDGVIFINKNHETDMLHYLNKVAQSKPNIIFTHIDPHHSEFKPVRKHFGVVDEPCLIATKPSKGLIYRLEPPVIPSRIDAFIETFEKESGKQYFKTERSKHPSMLTLQNSHLLEEMPKDILLFLYEEDHKTTKNLTSLVRYMVKYLKRNENLHVFACNLSRNELVLEVAMSPLPKVLYLRHRQKKSPVEFPYDSISPKNIIRFIKDNTVFDWPDDLGDEL